MPVMVIVVEVGFQWGEVAGAALVAVAEIEFGVCLGFGGFYNQAVAILILEALPGGTGYDAVAFYGDTHFAVVFGEAPFVAGALVAVLAEYGAVEFVVDVVDGFTAWKFFAG